MHTFLINKMQRELRPNENITLPQRNNCHSRLFSNLICKRKSTLVTRSPIYHNVAKFKTCP